MITITMKLDRYLGKVVKMMMMMFYNLDDEDNDGDGDDDLSKCC